MTNTSEFGPSQSFLWLASQHVSGWGSFRKVIFSLGATETVAISVGSLANVGDTRASSVDERKDFVTKTVSRYKGTTFFLPPPKGHNRERSYVLGLLRFSLKGVNPFHGSRKAA